MGVERRCGKMKEKGVLKMSRELNYPIKYAVLELKEKGGYLVGYKGITQGFIVSKCYVIRSNRAYNSDGSKDLTHIVVFPFKDISFFKKSFRNGAQNIGDNSIHSYDGHNDSYLTDVVTVLFNSYEPAKVVAEQKNEKHRQNLDWNERSKTLTSEFEQSLELCYLFEQLVLDATKDMKITEHLFSNNQDFFDRKTRERYHAILEETIRKYVNNPSDFYTQLASSLLPEEREHLMNSLEDRGCDNCTSGSCKVESYEKVGLDEFGNSQGSSCLGWQNAELIGRQLVKKL